nr:unnamed protein product [Haemonchus contortus]
MPKAVYNLIKASGHICQELPVDFGKRIFDASGNRMKFEMVVKIPVKECDGEQTTVAMHVSQQKGQTLILGTNALPSLGYNLVRRGRDNVVENAMPNDRMKETESERGARRDGKDTHQGKGEPRLACLCAGLVEDPKKWCDVPRAMEFYNHLTKQLKEYGDYLESLKVPKSMKPGGPAHAVDKEGGPPTTDGRISERHLKRVEKRQERGYAA